MKIVCFTLLFLPLMAVTTWAGTFALDLNDHSTQIGYAQKLDTQTYGDTLAKGRYLYNDDTQTHLFGLAGGVSGTPGNTDGLRLGLDVVLNGGQTKDSQKFLAAGLGFNAEYVPPMLHGFGVDTHLSYSPDIFSFLDGKDYFEWGVGASFLVLPNAKVTLAFQNIEVDIKGHGTRELDETLRLGVKLDF